MENGAQHVNERSRADLIGVIGGGWAGCAAALTLAERGYAVALFESASVLGGRARRIDRNGLALDNGQHLLLGAYEKTLELIARVAGQDRLQRVLARQPLTLVPFSPSQADALTIRARNAPLKLGLLIALLGATGLSLSERLANLRWLGQLGREEFRRPAHETVAHMIAPLPPRVARLLWEPLCLAALNTPAARASARVFANVLRATFAGRSDASDFLLNVTHLSAVFPDAVAAFLRAHAGSVDTGTSARVVQADHGGAVLEARRRALRVRAVVVAVGPHQLEGAFAPEILVAQPALGHALSALSALTYEPIATVWLGYGRATPMRGTILRLNDAPGQWLVDRPDVLAQAAPDPARPMLAQLIAVIISATGPHLSLPHSELVQAVDRQLRLLAATMPLPIWSQVVVERRATYACVPRRVRPDGPRAGPGIYLAGDYVDPDFPATLEAAVRTGIAAGEAIDGDIKAKLQNAPQVVLAG